MMSKYTVTLRRPHAQQHAILTSTAKRKAIRAGRRGGKTIGVSLLAIDALLKQHRVLYATPTQEQIDRFWFECKRALTDLIDGGVLHKNETRHVIEFIGTEARIRAKTAWNADTLRGDYADLLILDEWQLMNEDAWEVIGAPMMLDTNGDAVFVYTPPSFRTAGMSKAHDPRHAAKQFAKAAADPSGRWATFHFGSQENPYLSHEALSEIAKDMTSLAYRQEILAEDIDEIPGALWTRAMLESCRVATAPPLARVVTAIDPSATDGGDEAGIITGGTAPCACKGRTEQHAFIVADDSVQAHPREWARRAVTAYHRHDADTLIAEDNNGGQMVEVTISTIDHAPPVRRIHASRGKYTRAEPIAMLYEQGKVHHVGAFPQLEDELCSWLPGMASPNRLDALVWCGTELMLKGTPGI